MKSVQLKKICITTAALFVTTLFTGCGGASTGANTAISGITGPDVEVVNGSVVLSMVFQNVAVDAGATIPIPNYPNSSVQVGPDFQSAGTLLTLTVSSADFTKDLGVHFSPATLPGGRALPTVSTGTLPAIALTIPQLFNATFYVGPTAIGLFVPYGKIDLAGSIVSFRFFNKAGSAIGTLSLVGADSNGKNSGILMLMAADLLGFIKQTSAMAAQEAAISKTLN